MDGVLGVISVCFYEAPLSSGARMTNGVTVLTPQIEVYLGAGPARPAAFPTKYTRSDI